MTLRLHISDPKMEASASEIATAVLTHPLAQRLDWHTTWVMTAIAAGQPGIGPADARRVLRLALVIIDTAEIAVGLEVQP